MKVAGLVDSLLEFPVVTSFTRVGYDVRSRIDHWTPISEYDLSGRVVVVTGATSGLGRAAAESLARAGATLGIVGRDRSRTDGVCAALLAATGNERISPIIADMGDFDAVRHAADLINRSFEHVDVLIHNAGALSADRLLGPDGTEATVASQVVGPFLLTTLLLDTLRGAPRLPARVITMSSGGMYSADLTVDELEMSAGEYRGTEQYARAKRAQVTLNEMWSERVPRTEVVFHALHPGWADTPGVRESLPTFRKVVGPLLRSPDQGADTLVWLAADDGEPVESSGGFWLDRRERSIHRLARTRRSDTPERRNELWEWCVARSGLHP